LVSDKALLRKQKFVSLKEEHGSLDSLQKYIKDLKWNLWFDDVGNIVSMSKEPNSELDKNYQVTQFTNEQVKILKDKNWNLYRIVSDKFNNTVKFIEAKPIETEKVSSEEVFLYQIDNLKSRSYDLKFTVSKQKCTVIPSKKVLKNYSNVSDAVIKGRKTMIFYITAKNDPSFLFQTVTIPLDTLLQKQKFEFDIDSDIDHYSIFTLKLFDNYNFIKDKK